MNDDDFLAICLTAALTSVFWFIFLLWVTSNTNESWRDQIVGHGGAEYYIDQQYHRQWRWKDMPEKP